MAANAATLEQQLARARRRLFVGTLLAALAWAWAIALVLAVGWFVAWPYVPAGASSWLRWAVVGGLVGGATLTAIVLAWRWAPSPVTVALTLDERFGLKERVTTSLMLAPEQVATPAGQALRADAAARVAPLRIGDRFPVRVPWRPAALVPIAVLALVLLALLWQPGALPPNTAQGREDNVPSPEAKAEMEKKLKQVTQKPPRKATDPPPSKEIERIEAEFDKLMRAPRATKDDVNKRLKDATNLAEDIRKQQKAEADRIDAFKEQIKQVERLRKKEPPQEGPAKDVVRPFNDADFKAAQDALEQLSRRLATEEEKDRLRKKLKEDKEQLTPEQRKEAEDRLKKVEEEKKKQEEEQDRLRKKLKDKDANLTPEQRKEAEDELKRLQRDKEEAGKEEDRLRKKLKKKEEKLTPEQRKEAEDKLNKLERENDQQLSKKDKEDLKKQLEDLQDKAERLSRNKEKEKKDLEEKKEKQEEEQKKKEDELKKKEEKGEVSKEEAAQEREQLQREQDQTKKEAEKAEQDQKDLKEVADKLGECQECMKEGKDGEASKKLAEAAGKLGKMDRSAQQRQLQQQLQRLQQARRAFARGLSNKGGPGAGRRPDGKEGETGEEEKRPGTEFDKGKLEVVGTGGPDGGFKGPRTPAEMKEDIQRAVQEAPSAIDRQRLPASSKKITREFYEAFRGPETKKK